MAVYEIPLQPGTPQTLTVDLPGGTYQLRFQYIDDPEGGWIMDISASDGTPLAHGLPLVTGADLLAQYEYLDLGGALTVTTLGDPDAPPTFAGLGVASRLYFEPTA